MCIRAGQSYWPCQSHKFNSYQNMAFLKVKCPGYGLKQGWPGHDSGGGRHTQLFLMEHALSLGELLPMCSPTIPCATAACWPPLEARYIIISCIATNLAAFFTWTALSTWLGKIPVARDEQIIKFIWRICNFGPGRKPHYPTPQWFDSLRSRSSQLYGDVSTYDLHPTLPTIFTSSQTYQHGY